MGKVSGYCADSVVPRISVWAQDKSCRCLLDCDCVAVLSVQPLIMYTIHKCANGYNITRNIYSTSLPFKTLSLGFGVEARRRGFCRLQDKATGFDTGGSKIMEEFMIIKIVKFDRFWIVYSPCHLRWGDVLSQCLIYSATI